MDIESAVVVIEGKQWETDLPELGDLKVLVGAWENRDFNRALQKGIQALPPALRADGVVSPEAYYRVLGTAMAKAVLFDWQNMKAASADKPYDAASALTYLTDPKYKPFRDGVIVASKRVQQGIKSDEEDLVGNSPASSPGSGTGEATKTA